MFFSKDEMGTSRQRHARQPSPIHFRTSSASLRTSSPALPVLLNRCDPSAARSTHRSQGLVTGELAAPPTVGYWSSCRFERTRTAEFQTDLFT
jgi:hypothetical protein